MKGQNVSQMSPRDRVLIIAELTRNVYAVDYWEAQLSTLRERKDLMRGEVKHLYNRCEHFIGMYRHELMEAINGSEAREIFLDNVYEFHKQLSRMVGYYEQAIKRRLDKGKQPHSAFTHRFAVAKDLLDIVTVIQGHEARASKGSAPNYYRTPLYGMLHMGWFPARRSYAAEARPDEYGDEPASTLGTLVHLCGDMNLAILRALGQKDLQFEAGEDKEIDRAVEICCRNLVTLMQDYEHISIMFEDDGHTWAEAVEIFADRKEKHLQAIEKAQHQLAVKAAKKESKKKENERGNNTKRNNNVRNTGNGALSCRDAMLEPFAVNKQLIQTIKN